MRRQLLPALRMTIALVVVLGLAYPLLMTGAAQALFPSRANGSLARSAGSVIGSELIGQAFSQPRYFHPRPSAAGSDGYDPTASGGSSLGPSNPKLLDAVAERAKAYRVENDLAADAAVPVDAVTASGSGLDPDISVANAEGQAGRVARARGLAPSEVLDFVRAHTTDRPLGVLGERRVNVLELNLALDAVH